jgi:hypothetical protein
MNHIIHTFLDFSRNGGERKVKKVTGNWWEPPNEFGVCDKKPVKTG